MISNRENTAMRLKTIMEQRNLRQINILELTRPYCEKYSVKMNKSDISQYISGKVEPSQEKLVILSMALNVSESWLMGFDVPMERGSTSKCQKPKNISENCELIMQITEKMLAEGLIDMSGFSSLPEAAGHVAVVIESCFKDHSRKYDTEEDKEGRKE